MADDLISFDNLQAVLEEYVKEAKELYKEKLRKDGRLATATLHNNINTHVDFNGREYEVSLDLAKYWRYIETDTEPHWPPFQAILDWVKVKPVLPHGGGFSLRRETWQKQLTFLIRRKIGVFGTKGTPNLTDTVEEMNAKYEQRIAEALAEDMQGYIRKVIAN